ncbi:MAG: hypothetical protein RL059_652, partial [Bacteroidota bacterium]
KLLDTSKIAKDKKTSKTAKSLKVNRIELIISMMEMKRI